MDIFQGEAMNPAVAEIIFVANPVFAVYQQVIDRYIQIVNPLT
jgi:phage tail protein X